MILENYTQSIFNDNIFSESVFRIEFIWNDFLKVFLIFLILRLHFGIILKNVFNISNILMIKIFKY